MDRSVFRALARLGWIVYPPSPFAEGKNWMNCAKRIWFILERPDMQSIWLRDRSVYLKAVAAAKYCERRANG